ncbi:hypothetical protein [Nitrospirillum amazonense]|uniref:hypothetical protein n=1 Tax=Nitrospirillum amazonense TaxID=28077 RepID=UPI0011A37506|nr:hypothetical protein [Nitrospirillum amazonense]
MTVLLMEIFYLSIRETAGGWPGLIPAYRAREGRRPSMEALDTRHRSLRAGGAWAQPKANDAAPLPSAQTVMMGMGR